jgi:hypothetical protein
MAIEQLLKSKYHATRLGVFNKRQLATIDGILNKETRQAIGLLPNFPMQDRATQMGIEHITRVMNKDTERGFTGHAHVHCLLFQFNH